MPVYDYDYTDKIIAYLDKQLIDRYAKLKGLVSFDELNVMQSVSVLYQELSILVRKMFLQLAEHTYNAAVKRKSFGSIDEEWVDRLLNAYDPTSKYIFTHEEDRKRARLVEALIASTTKTKEIDAAMRSMSLMWRAYAIKVTDEAVLQAYEDEEEDNVRWIAEDDEKTCSVCLSRHGKVYAISKLPPKPHINCRCRFERIK
ncbi:MAG: hypothetical protein J1F03_00175 [Oscillospiraceae bacterium]|nr:hypothetical protein [Oscillospiraceae bacterium]